MARQTLLVSFAALLVLTSAEAAFSGNDPDNTVTTDYRSAVTFQNNLLFDLAIPQWRKVIAKHPDAQRVEEARYHLATCYYYEKDFRKSLDQLTFVLGRKSTRPRDPRHDLRRKAIALTAANYLQMRQADQARETLALLAAEFPNDKQLAEDVENGKYPTDLAELKRAVQPAVTAPK